MSKDTLQYAQRRQDRDERTAALADQRQRHTRHRQQSNVHADVHKDLKQDERHHADRDQPPEGVVGEAGDPEAAEQERMNSPNSTIAPTNPNSSAPTLKT